MVCVLLAVILNVVLPPAQISRFTGCVPTVTGLITVSVTALDVVDVAQADVATTRYWLPFCPAVVPVTVYNYP